MDVIIIGFNSLVGNPMCQLTLHLTGGPRCVNASMQLYVTLQRRVHRLGLFCHPELPNKLPGPLTWDYLQCVQQHTLLSNT